MVSAESVILRARRGWFHGRAGRVRVRAASGPVTTHGPGPTPAEARASILSEHLARRGHGRLGAMCAVVARATATHAELCVMTPTGPSLVDTGARPSGLLDAEASTGEGPVHAATATHEPVLVEDLAAQGHRWPGFAAATADLDVAAVFVLPLLAGQSVPGALQLTRSRPGALTDLEESTALTFAEIATELVLDAVEAAARAEGSVSAVDAGKILGHRIEVYQAQGMLMARLGISLDEALARMRATSFARGVDLVTVATDIVARRGDVDPG